MISDIKRNFESFNKNFNELILLTNFLTHLTREFEGIFLKVRSLIDEMDDLEGINVKNILSGEISGLDSLQGSFFDHKSSIRRLNRQYEELKIEFEDLVNKNLKYPGEIPDENKIIELNKKLIKASDEYGLEIINTEEQLLSIEKGMFEPVKKFGEIFSDLILYNLNSDNSDILQFINETINNISVLIKDFRLSDNLQKGKIVQRNADFNIENIVGKIIDKYSFSSHYENINLFYNIDRNLPSNIIAEKYINENIISILIEISVIFILISEIIEPSVSLKKIQLNLINSGNNEARLSVMNSGIALKENSFNAVYSLFSFYSGEFPFAVMKLKMVEDLIKLIGSNLEIFNEENMPCLGYKIKYEILG